MTDSLLQIQKKLEYYCAYQDRCHQEVIQKLYDYKVFGEEQEQIIIYLIENKFLNEERFAQSFARGKHRIKNWGRVRITNELKFRNVSSYNIKTGLKEIDANEYLTQFDQTSEKFWAGISETNSVKKRKKFCDYFLRKGYESDLIYERVKELEKESENL